MPAPVRGRGSLVESLPSRRGRERSSRRGRRLGAAGVADRRLTASARDALEQRRYARSFARLAAAIAYSYQISMSHPDRDRIADGASDARRFAPATERNREAILDVLARYVRDDDDVLEIASGTGEHATFLGERLRVASWQPSDPDATSRASIDAWTAHLDATRVRPAIELDVTRLPWPVSRADVVACINMIHIAPWRACLALLDGASELLARSARADADADANANAAQEKPAHARGFLYLYGPYRRAGIPTAPSNESFDQSLRSRDPSWGLRDLETVVAEAKTRGFSLEDVVEMPANNLSVVLRLDPP
jgi:hypothetical protein